MSRRFVFVHASRFDWVTFELLLDFDTNSYFAFYPGRHFHASGDSQSFAAFGQPIRVERSFAWSFGELRSLLCEVCK